jgi:hypothetical protein
MSYRSAYEGNDITLTAAEALGQYRLITAAGALADGTDAAIGTVPLPIASGARGAVRLFSAGLMLVVASGAIDAGVAIYQATDGKVTASGANAARLLGVSLEAASGDGAVLAAVPVSHAVTATSVAVSEISLTQNNVVLGNASNVGALLATGATGRSLLGAATAAAANLILTPGPLQGRVSETVDDDKTLDAQDVGKTMNVTVTGKVVTLPATAAGLEFAIRCGTAGIAVTVSPNANDKIMGADLAGEDNKDRLLAVGAVGDYLVLRSDGTHGWYVIHENGTWTAEE